MFDEVKKLIKPHKKNEKQRIIPFLGAGIYSSFLNHADGPQFEHYEEEKIRKILEEDLGLKDKNAINLGRLVLEIAFMLQQDADKKKNNDKLEHIPSAQELAQIICQWIGNDTFKDYANHLCHIFSIEGVNIDLEDLSSLLYDILKINSYYFYKPSLSSISEFYQKKHDRYRLWNNLYDLFTECPEQPTDIHKKLAKIASEHINLNQFASNYRYLIITTNYDTLMECALESYDLPYAVISTNTLVGQENYGRVNIRFSDNIPNKARLEKRLSNVIPKDFIIEYIKELRNPVVLIYKIHGCLHKDLTPEEDCLVISDSDYVSFISRMSDISNGGIPGFVNNEIEKKPLLFLGYSFRDWNIRTFLMKLREKRQHIKDFAIMKFLTDSESSIFTNEYKISVINMDVFDFMGKI